MKKLVYRHNRITRTTHWVNALVLMILIMSGFQIFNAHPHLYWGNTSEPDQAFLSIAAAAHDGDVRGFFRLYGWEFDTTGVLGVQQTDMGPAFRAFPSWLTVPGYFWLAGGRRWHFFFGWLFALNGFLYVVYNIASGHLRKFLLSAKDAVKVPAMALYYLRIRKQSPQQGEYNPLQKLAYTGVFFVLTPLILLSGMAMSPQLDTAFHWLPAIFGGRQSARSIHFILAFFFVGFTFGHVFMVLATGVFNNMRSMVTGWYKEKGLPPDQSANEEAIQDPGSAQPPEPSLSPELGTIPAAKDAQADSAGTVAQEDDSSKATSKDECPGSESSPRSSPDQVHQTKKDLEE